MGLKKKDQSYHDGLIPVFPHQHLATPSKLYQQVKFITTYLGFA